MLQLMGERSGHQTYKLLPRRTCFSWWWRGLVSRLVSCSCKTSKNMLQLMGERSGLQTCKLLLQDHEEHAPVDGGEVWSPDLQTAPARPWRTYSSWWGRSLVSRLINCSCKTTKNMLQLMAEKSGLQTYKLLLQDHEEHAQVDGGEVWSPDL